MNNHILGLQYFSNSKVLFSFPSTHYSQYFTQCSCSSFSQSIGTGHLNNRFNMLYFSLLISHSFHFLKSDPCHNIIGQFSCIVTISSTSSILVSLIYTVIHSKNPAILTLSGNLITSLLVSP